MASPVAGLRCDAHFRHRARPEMSIDIRDQAEASSSRLRVNHSRESTEAPAVGRAHAKTQRREAVDLQC
jgi:hypothetical protein